jgi:hypothetical protein
LREGVRGALGDVEVAGVAEAGSIVDSDVKQPANEGDRSFLEFHKTTTIICMRPCHKKIVLVLKKIMTR